MIIIVTALRSIIISSVMLAFSSWAFAQTAPLPPASSTSPAVPSSPTSQPPAAAVVPAEGAAAPPAVRKKNERPAVAATAAIATVKTPPEPYDTATAAKMAGTCVRLTTEAGVINIEMIAEAAPETVRNFLNLTATGAFNTTAFNRIVKGFVVQGGNLATRQTLTQELIARARRTILDEPNYIKHVRGIVSMARAEQANSATTNFFIVVGDAAPHLDGKFAAFGQVTSGIEVVDIINQAPAIGETPAKPVRIISAVVTQGCAQISLPPPSSPTSSPQ